MQGVLLLDVAASGERQAHHHGAVRPLRHLEVEILGIDGLAGVQAERILRLAGLEDIEVGAVVVLVVLDLHGIRLGAAGGEFHLDLAVLEGDDLLLSAGSRLQQGVLVDGHGGRLAQGGRHAVGLRCGPLRLGELALQRFDAGDGIQLRLQLRPLAGLASLENGETDEDDGNQDEADD